METTALDWSGLWFKTFGFSRGCLAVRQWLSLCRSARKVFVDGSLWRCRLRRRRAMSNQADGAVILDLLVASASATIVVAGVSTRGSTGPRRGAERTALLISGLTPFPVSYTHLTLPTIYSV